MHPVFHEERLGRPKRCDIFFIEVSAADARALRGALVARRDVFLELHGHRLWEWDGEAEEYHVMLRAETTPRRMRDLMFDYGIAACVREATGKEIFMMTDLPWWTEG